MTDRAIELPAAAVLGLEGPGVIAVYAAGMLDLAAPAPAPGGRQSLRAALDLAARLAAGGRR